MGQYDRVVGVASVKEGPLIEEGNDGARRPRGAGPDQLLPSEVLWGGTTQPGYYLHQLHPGVGVALKSIQDCRVLVVDDEETIRDVVADALKLEGYPVSTAANGAEALRLVDEENPSLVLLDMRMPIVDGWEFSRELRQRGYRTPIVVITAARNAKRWAEEIGAAGYLAKPFDLDDLLQMVERFCLGTE